MATYVDSLFRFPGHPRFPWAQSCHLFADSEAELHALAQELGMKVEWSQIGRRGILHYDLNPERRARAIELGALPLSRRESVAKWRSLRDGEKENQPAIVGSEG